MKWTCWLCMAGALLGAAPVNTARVTITRSDFTAAQQRFEAAFAAHHPQDLARLREIHRAYDQGLLHRLNDRLGPAIATLNALTESLESSSSDPKIARLVHSLQVRISPNIAWRTRPGVMRIRVARMYPTDTSAPAGLKLVIRSDQANARPVLEAAMNLQPDGAPFALTRAGPSAPAGSYRVELVAADGSSFLMDHWYVIDAPLNLARAAIEHQLRGVAPTDSAKRLALIACLSRGALLLEHPDENVAAQYLVDPIDLGNQVKHESESLAQGDNPYQRRQGDWWCMLQMGSTSIPVRIYGPPQVALDPPLPLVIAMAGAGNDESGFMQFYGNGRLKQLAEKNGLVIVAPNPAWLANMGNAMEALINNMSLLYSIDRSRVYVIGHGDGASIATRLVTGSNQPIAGLVLVGGGELETARRLPRTRLYCGEIDPFFTVDQARVLSEQAAKSQLPLDVRIVAGAGHGLLVDEVLDDAIDWLIKPEPATGPASAPATP